MSLKITSSESTRTVASDQVYPCFPANYSLYGNISILPLKTPYVVARSLVPRRSLLIRCPREVWERAHSGWLLYQIIRCTNFSRVVLEERGKRHVLVVMFKVFNANIIIDHRTFGSSSIKTSEVHNYNLMGSNYDLQLPLPKTKFLKRSFSYRSAMACNQLSHQRRKKKDGY